ncbi:MAG: hypothetical protein ACOY4R_28965 [Pseudomonadota bacterium]
MTKTGVGAALIVALLASIGNPAVAQQGPARTFPAEVRGQVEEMMNRSVLAPPPAPTATCGTIVAGQEKDWAAPAPWKRVFSHHPSEWSWLRQYPAGTNLRFCQYTAPVTGTQPEVSYTAEVATLNGTAAQLVTWMASACRTAIRVTGTAPDRFDECVRGLYWGLPLQAPDDKKKLLGLRQFSAGQFVAAGAVTLDASRGGVVCHRDGVALLRERPGLPAVGYFVLTETPDGKTAKQVTDGELAECFKIGAPKEWPGGSAAQPVGTTRDQFWNALPRLGRTPAEFGLSTRADLEPSEVWRRVVREAQLAALKADSHVLIDAWVLANASALLR